MAKNKLVLELDPKDKKRLETLLNKVADGVSDLKPFFEAVEMHMIDSLTKNFESGGRPQRWKPLAPVTVALKGSSAPLQDKGDLKRSINAQNTQKSNLSLQIWAGEKHGQYHQDPDEDPLRQFTMENKRGMPFRPFMLFQDEDIKEIERILDKYMDSLGI